MALFASPSTCCIRNINFGFTVRYTWSWTSSLNLITNSTHFIELSLNFGTSILERFCCTSHIIAISELAVVGDSMFLRDHVHWANLSRNLLHWEQYLCLHILYFLGNGESYPSHPHSWCFFFILVYLQKYIFFFSSSSPVAVGSLFLFMKLRICGWFLPYFFPDWSHISKQYLLIFQVVMPLYVSSFQVNLLTSLVFHYFDPFLYSSCSTDLLGLICLQLNFHHGQIF